tara:strand:+ start:8527 stop:9345 length:819 start_codon:yes stop_codon:yes gene_type:complete
MCRRWKRVHRLSRCPICGKPDWCLVAPDRSAAICPRIEEGSSRHIEGSGYLHILKVTDQWMDEEYHPKGGVSALPEHNEVLAIRARQWIRECPTEKITELSDRLGVSQESLRRLNVGWFENSSSWIFPMQRKGHRLIGIRTRPKTGKKFAIKGSKNGLFIPNNIPEDDIVYVCEGESDTAALLTCGLSAIGRPSCNSGDRLVAELLDNRLAVVCMDRDGVGRKGAEALAQLLRCHAKDVRMFEPPDKYKDMREWLHGEGKEDIYNKAKRLYG